MCPEYRSRAAAFGGGQTASAVFPGGLELPLLGTESESSPYDDNFRSIFPGEHLFPGFI